MRTAEELSETRIDPERDHLQGEAEAPIQLLEYGDFECPYCAEAHVAIKEVQKKLKRKLCFAYRHFPLVNKHQSAEAAAEAAESAAVRGKFWEMHDLLFENQDALDEDDLMQYAEEAGVEGGDLIEEVNAGTYAERIQEDQQAGKRAGVEGTPVFFINGNRYEGDLETASLLEALQATLQKQSP